ncbi:IS66 family transposase [Limnohabitans curvus]|uniref:IS66 family transposase n=1 Tax=Limnohabitans curvus TaxID=323423 RepID=UPI003CCBF592
MAKLDDATRSIVEQLLQRIERNAHQIHQQAIEIAKREAEIVKRDAEINWRDAKIEKLTFEMAQLKRVQFGVKSERLNVDQQHLFEEAVSADLAAIEAELDELKASAVPTTQASSEKSKPKRAALPANLPRVERHHEPENTMCGCSCELKRIGEDVSEKLDYEPGQFTVERHVRGKWACLHCKTLIQAPVAAEVIDKGIPTSGLLAHVLVAKHADHLPLYRQEAIFGRAGLAIPRSTLAAWVGVCGVRLQPLADALKRHVLNCQVVHADETPVAMLAPGKGKTHRAYLWAYAAGVFEQTKAVVYDFQPGRSGEHARNFLGNWRGSLVCDDYGGYKACFAGGVTEVGCMAHARRKFMDLLLANQNSLAQTALDLMGQLYGIERRVKDESADKRLQVRQSESAAIADQLHRWLKAQRQRVPDGTASAKAMDYCLKRWVALTRFIEDGNLPIDNNHDEQQIRPWATGRKNWLFAGSLMAGQRAAAITSLIQSAKLNGLDPYMYLSDVLTRLPTHKASDIDLLMPHIWKPASWECG